MRGAGGMMGRYSPHQVTPMEFHISCDAAMPDIGVIEGAILDQDPAAVVDLDAAGQTVRLATWIESPQLLALLNGAGWPIPAERIVQLPSVCCGGCGG